MTPHAMRIDAHQHYWSVAHDDYGWLQPTPVLRPIYRDFAPHDLRPWLDRAGIDATVLVQAAPSEAETHRLLACAAQPGSRLLRARRFRPNHGPDIPVASARR